MSTFISMENAAKDIPIQYLKGIGPKRAQSFAKHGIKNVEDLFYYFPRRYEDRTKFVPIAMLQEGESQTIKARINARMVRLVGFRR